MRVLAGIPGKAVMVCGPITSGGLRCVVKNTARLEGAIEMLAHLGEPVFTQLPLSGAITRISGNAAYYRGLDHLLETVYLPLFQSGYLSRLYFLPGWQSSLGATWEHARALELGLEIRYIHPAFDSFLHAFAP